MFTDRRRTDARVTGILRRANKRYETYQTPRTEFSFCRLGHAQGVGLRGAWGSKNYFL